MNYRHSYHAGNFADILKHLILCFCLEKLCEKEKPFFVLDTHSGRGKYDLDDENSVKTLEAKNGIRKILQALKSDSELLPKSFLGILARTNRCEISELNRGIKFYPGSPLITRNFIRNNDRAIFAELQKDEFLKLKKTFTGGKNIFFHNEDGLHLLKSKLPPLEKRGLILIDPAFEKFESKISADYEKVVNALRESYKRFAHGIYVIWYPIIENDKQTLEKFKNDITKIGFEKITDITLTTKPHQLESGKISSMTSCGCVIINAPWQLEEKMDFYLKKIEGVLLT